jgi:hypothetical protein
VFRQHVVSAVRPWTSASLLAGVAILLHACADGGSGNHAEDGDNGIATITGEIQLSGPTTDVTTGLNQAGRGDEPCSGAGRWRDLREGGQVVVSNESGTTIAVGSIISSKRVVEVARDFSASTISCTLGYQVTGVPGAAFYTIEAGDAASATLSREELERRFGIVNLRVAN